MKSKIVFIKTVRRRCYCQKCGNSVFEGNFIAYDTFKKSVCGCESCLIFLRDKKSNEQTKKEEYYSKERYIGNYEDESLEIFDFM